MVLRTTPSRDTNTSRLVGGPSGVQQQLTPRTPVKKGTAQPAPLGAVVGEHWRARSVLGTLPDGQKTGLWRTLNQVPHSAQGLHSVSILRGVHCWGVRHTRHARGRSARRPPPSLAADHAAALWQLWCRVGRTTTITCQVVESHALYHRLQRATGAGRGENAGTAQRAGDGGRTYPANQHRVCIHTLSCVRRLTMLVPIGTAFGYGTRTHTLSRTLRGLTVRRSPSIGRAEARATDATRGDSRALLDESTARARRVDRCKGRVDLARVASGRVPRGDSTLHGVHSPGRVAARGVPLAAGRRSTRCGEAPGAAVDSSLSESRIQSPGPQKNTATHPENPESGVQTF